MESRLPKPTCLKGPTPVTSSAKTILPMDRIRANTTILSKTSNMPLTQDLSNLQTFSTRKRGGSPKQTLAPTTINRAALRRSKSVGDLGETMKSRPLKRADSTLAPIPSKVSRLGVSANSTINGRAGLLANRPKAPPAINNRTKLRRSQSVGDLRETMRSRPLKRADLTLAPIPSKAPRSGVSAANSTINGRSGLLANRPKLATAKPPNMKPVSTKPTTAAAKETTAASTKGAAGKAAINKRIPPYDYKARFNDLVEKHKALKDKYDENKELLANFESLPEQYEESQSQLISTREELKNAQVEIECMQRQNNAQGIKIASITKCLQTTKDDLDKLTEKYEKVSTEHEAMTKEVIELREIKDALKSENSELLTELTECKEQLFRANLERKDLHNLVMDLRGNIRVFCRVRPPLDTEEDRLLCGWNYLDEASLEIQNLELMSSGAKNKTASHVFSFDHVFHSKSTQEDVFEMVSPLIQSALDGYNICIFAYGQTGSGKTFTMDGVPNNVGVIPRTVDLLFESVQNYKRLGWTYEIKVTFLEIYNEVLYDLLSNEQKDMEIRMAKNKTDIYVSNITEETVNSASRLRQLMQIAKMNRATASTAGNERSSRSHAVTRIELIGTHAEKSEVSIGTINLVDLAGSESPKTSTRMNETKNINRSLSELTNVILALLQKQDHIPYRNSKLTHLLMPSLGGNSKTLMFINVAPFQDCFVESVKSLRFAASVNSCKMTKAKKNKFLNTSSATTTASTSAYL